MDLRMLFLQLWAEFAKISLSELGLYIALGVYPVAILCRVSA